ncbi:MAG: MazG nucleotide pyrophosphohydrolase domain-containing protein [Aliarcobacter sp.]|jgi:NTP pyrophosphatase (non-canonical NTP hydrolase)|nr:MazG nucleotide pyrophosphohydrolase domain-containing protein [Aliarcobacter sp.]
MTLDEIKEFQKKFDLQFKGNIEFHEEIDETNIEPLEHLIVCMLGEFGEFSNLVKKVKRGDFTLNEVKGEINEEFIDIFIYLIKVANQLDINIENEYLKKMSKNKLKFEKFLK